MMIQNAHSSRWESADVYHDEKERNTKTVNAAFEKSKK